MLRLLLIGALMNFSAFATTKAAKGEAGLIRQEWRDQDTVHEIWLDTSLVSQQSGSSRGLSGLVPQEHRLGKGIRLFRKPRNLTRAQLATRFAGSKWQSVYRTAGSSRAPLKVLTGALLIEFPSHWTEDKIREYSALQKLEYKTRLPFSTNLHLILVDSGKDVLEVQEELFQRNPELKISPEWHHELSKR